jgi:hypothetical protein
MTPAAWEAVWRLRDTPFRVALLGLRGYFAKEGPTPGNDLGIYDDAIIRRIGADLTLWRASTDPGLKWIAHPITPKGCASLALGGPYYYAPGLHKGRPALVQDDEVCVDRLDPQGNPTSREWGDFGINIHSGGSEYAVGSFSAGCQVIHSPEGAWGATWLRFFDPISSAMKETGQRRLPYLLIDRLPATNP